MTDFNNTNGTFGQAPTAFGQAPQAPTGFGQAPTGFGQAPATPAPSFGGGTPAPSFGGGAQAGGRTWGPVTASELGWLTPEEEAQCAAYENNFRQIESDIPARFDLNVEGAVTFSALASPFLPKVDNKNNGHLWELSITIKDPKIVGDVHPFARYAFAKRLSRNSETGDVTYRFTNAIRDTEPNMTRDHVKQVAMGLKTKAGKPIPAWPVPLMDSNNNQNVTALMDKDFATDGSQIVTLALQLVRTQNLPSVAKYVWFKPYLQGVIADFNNIHWNEFKGSQFRAAQEHALEQARLAMQNGAQAESAGFAPEQPGFGQAPQVAPQGFGGAQPAFNQPDQGFGQAPATPAPSFGQAPQQAAPTGFDPSAQQAQPGFGQAPTGFDPATQPAQPGFGQAPTGFDPAAQQAQNGFGQAPTGFDPAAQQAAPQTPFAPPFEGGTNSPFVN